MKRPTRRTTVVVVVAFVAMSAIVGGALAASGTFDPAQQQQAFLNDVAGRLGTTSDKLLAALKAAAIDQVDAALAAGQITQAQAQAIKDAINAGKLPLGGLPFGGGFGFRHEGLVAGPGKFLDAAASYLGLTTDQLLTQLQSGKSLADVAKAQGKSVSGLEQAIITDVRSRLDQAVKDGKLTQAQADQIISDLKSHIDDLVNNSFPGPTPTGKQGSGMFRFGGHIGGRYWAPPTPRGATLPVNPSA